jgi:hypothetical protein
MKLTTKVLKQLIKEELQKELLKETAANANVSELVQQSLNHSNRAEQHARVRGQSAFNKEVLLAIKAVREAVNNLNQIEHIQRALQTAQKKQR